MVYRNNAGRLGAGFISVCLETRWLGHLGGFYVPECYCSMEIPKDVVFSHHSRACCAKMLDLQNICPYVIKW